MSRWKHIMKACPFEESRLLRWKPPHIVSLKYDGDRSWNDGHPSGSTLLTSEGNIRSSVPHINLEIDELRFANLPLDGEMYSHELYLEGGHELIHSIASRTVNLHPRHKEMQFHVFDLKIPDMSFAERLHLLTEASKAFKKYLIFAPIWICHTLDEVKHAYDKAIEWKYEGIVIREHNAFYDSDKHSTHMMKFKPKKKDEYEIVGWKEEVSIDGDPKGRIGSLILSSKLGEHFSVGAGLDANQKDYLWSIRDRLVGNKAIIHFQHLTQKKIPKGTFDIEIPGILTH